MAGGPPLRRLSRQRVRVYTLDPHVRRLQHPGLQTSRQRCRFVAGGDTPGVRQWGWERGYDASGRGDGARALLVSPRAVSIECGKCKVCNAVLPLHTHEGILDARAKSVLSPGEGPWPGLWERHGKEAPRTPQTDSPAFPLPRKARSSPGFSGPRPLSRVTGPCGPGPLDLQSCPSEWDRGTLQWDDNSRYRAFQAPGPSCPRPLCEDRKCRAALRP